MRNVCVCRRELLLQSGALLEVNMAVQDFRNGAFSLLRRHGQDGAYLGRRFYSASATRVPAVSGGVLVP